MSIENDNGVHVEERAQIKEGKDMTTADKLAKFAKLNKHPYVASDLMEDVDKRGRVRILEE